jgi:hypothetical protein
MDELHMNTINTHTIELTERRAFEAVVAGYIRDISRPRRVERTHDARSVQAAAGALRAGSTGARSAGCATTRRGARLPERRHLSHAR